MSEARDPARKEPVATDATTPSQTPAEGAVDTAAAAAPAAPASPPPSAQEPAATADASAPAVTETAAAPAAAQAGAPARPLVVGVGASAGGLEAFEELLRVMPPDSGHAFVVVQHLDPTHSSLLTEILQRATAMAVTEATDKVAVLPNHVYVIPPNRDMVILQGCLRLYPPQEPHGLRMPIDSFLRSLANDQAEHAVAIILSGSGSDGTLGIRAVYGAGGLCLAQEPDSAKFGGMPQSAIHSGYVNQVLPVDQMPAALASVARALDSTIARKAGGTEAPVEADKGLERILVLLRAGCGHDFTQYKRNTLRRRVERRMAVRSITDIAAYARYLQQQPGELKLLFREMLINVTSFFRDPEAFLVLKTDILPPLMKDRGFDNPLRVWVAGCSTGEEAYSIAMVLRELMGDTAAEVRVQVYATDLDDEAIATARAARYPSNIAQDVGAVRLRRFFLLDNNEYVLKKEVREMVVFAVQNLAQDPPFTRLDLLSCRNVMIYMEPELQARLIPAFHYALKVGGVLFLSPAESIGNHTELFESVNRHWNFYRARASFASTRSMLSTGLNWSQQPTLAKDLGLTQRTRDIVNLAELAKRQLLHSYAPPAVLTDQQGEVLFVHGETGRFLRLAPGAPTHNVIEMAREGLDMPLREALRHADAMGTGTLSQRVNIRTEGAPIAIDLSVRTLADSWAGRPLVLITFSPVVLDMPTLAMPRPRQRPVPQQLAELTSELERAKQRTKMLLEEQQATTEELKSINEELQSTNEELQSTNEELETSKEELQSVNEELLTVNAELHAKIEQMSGMQDDMKNLLDNIRVGTVFLDRNLMIRRFTKEATKVYRLLASDLGRPLADIRTVLEGGDPVADAATVIETLVPLERELSLPDGTWFLARTQPYRTVDNVIDGVVLTFTDITERVHSMANQQARDLAVAVVDSVPEPLLVLDDRFTVVSANRSYFRKFGGAADTVLGQSLFLIGDEQWNDPNIHEILEVLLPRDQHVDDVVIEHEFGRLGKMRLRLAAHRVVLPGRSGELMLLVIEDLGLEAAAS
jgi:two-component system CheB/CheR fusion protein